MRKYLLVTGSALVLATLRTMNSAHAATPTESGGDLKSACMAPTPSATPSSLQNSFTACQQLLKKDPTDHAAQAQILEIRKRLSDLATPFKNQASTSAAEDRILEARKAIRQAILINPYDPALQQESDTIDARCREKAERQLEKAEIYESAENYPEGIAALESALSYIDRDAEPTLYRRAKALRARMENIGGK